MKLSGKYFYIFVIISAVLFAGYWIGTGSYLAFHSKKFWFQNILFRNTITDLNQPYDESATINSSTPANENMTFYLIMASGNVYGGRLGNHMFMYASLLGLTRAQKRKLFMLPGEDLEETFNIQNVGDNQTVENWTTVTEIPPVTFDRKMTKLPLRNVKINGCLQSFLYFSDVMDIVRQEFTFRDNIANKAAAIVNDVRAKYRPSLLVGVHARRGDFLTQGQNSGYAVPQKSYFFKAFDWMRSTFPGRKITFIIASDDLPWCQANLTGNDVVVMPPATPAVHLAVLSSCDHVIISGGTFGWWAGWLSGGRVIYFTGYLAKDTYFGKYFKPNEYYPRLWIGLGD